jgi:hypothetical protein
MKKYIYIITIILELAFCNKLYACSICLWEITGFYFPSLMHWFFISFIWMILQIRIDYIFKVHHTYKLTVLKFVMLFFLSFIISGALLGPYPFIWLLMYPLIIFINVVINEGQKYNTKYRSKIILTGIICIILLSVSFAAKKIEISGLTNEQLIEKYDGTAVEKFILKN